MKFFLAMLTYVIAALILGIGILQAVKGHPALLIGGVLSYSVLLGAIGCLPQKTH